MFAVRITSLHMELVSYIHSTKPFSSLPRDELFVQAPDRAPPRQVLSPLILHLPPLSLTVLIYSKGCYPNEPEHNSYHSSPHAVTPQLLSLSTGENASSVFPQGWNKTEILGVQVEWQNHWPGTQETCFVLPCKSFNLTEPRESYLYNGHEST